MTRAEADAIRDWDRGLLWSTLDHAMPLPAQDGTAPVVDAAIVHIVRTPSALALISLEDLIGEEEQPNLPGTTTEHPNWRRRIATPLDELLADKRVQQCCNTLNRRRPNPVV